MVFKSIAAFLRIISDSLDPDGSTSGIDYTGTTSNGNYTSSSGSSHGSSYDQCTGQNGVGYYKSRPLPPAPRGGLKEFSVLVTDRALNHMSTPFQHVMRDLHEILTDVYRGSRRMALIPGGGTYAMESVARQLIPSLGKDAKVLVIRNGYFSYRWSDIFTTAGVVPEHIILKAQKVKSSDTITNSDSDDDDDQPSYAPPPIEQVITTIVEHKPDIIFAPHVETSTGILLPDSYIARISHQMRATNPNSYFVLDGIAAGYNFVDLSEVGADFYISAPQKAWSAPAGAGIVMMGSRGYDRVKETKSDSFSINLGKWTGVMESYLGKEGSGPGEGMAEWTGCLKKSRPNPLVPNPGPIGGFSYHATMPTDALQLFRDAALDTHNIFGTWRKAKDLFQEQGEKVYDLIENTFKMKVVASKGYRAPSVVVVYNPRVSLLSQTDAGVIGDDDSSNGKHEQINMFTALKNEGLQIAGGVPWQLGENDGRGGKSKTNSEGKKEPEPIRGTWRIGLFGIEKIGNSNGDGIEKTVNTLEDAIRKSLERAGAKGEL